MCKIFESYFFYRNDKANINLYFFAENDDCDLYLFFYYSQVINQTIQIFPDIRMKKNLSSIQN